MPDRSTGSTAIWLSERRLIVRLHAKGASALKAKGLSTMKYSENIDRRFMIRAMSASTVSACKMHMLSPDSIVVLATASLILHFPNGRFGSRKMGGGSKLQGLKRRGCWILDGKERTPITSKRLPSSMCHWRYDWRSTVIALLSRCSSLPQPVCTSGRISYHEVAWLKRHSAMIDFVFPFVSIRLIRFSHFAMYAPSLTRMKSNSTKHIAGPILRKTRMRAYGTTPT
ncbi:hypothetical protein BJ508DRAFT_156649 [Ascobolus immersus RN42]|uniref:Uncharacterized protein n=1 Tax=Ascobolus immersus RN42 TaxID=1160509 RepID=A0A3N4HWQ5_ASCIM|nr:hypothetical protein BJ508DRAFT_156649 [Ascobolus immersus RN42]